MTTFNSYEEYQNKCNKIALGVGRVGDITGREAAQYMVAKMRAMAPRKSGGLSRNMGYYQRKYGEYTVYTGPSEDCSRRGFREQALFINNALLLHIHEYNPFFAVGQTVRYGSPAKTPTGKNVEWTQTPYATAQGGYFFAASTLAKAFYREIFTNKVRTILRQ